MLALERENHPAASALRRLKLKSAGSRPQSREEGGAQETAQEALGSSKKAGELQGLRFGK